ncbi:MAG: SDR family NAD(P)-dependent oxidoreductase [Thermoanaerobaculia bacterium]|nr:SDR family NAD(P)-dependent oxidoreductase [Thermoanaerobaculia bacterium]
MEEIRSRTVVVTGGSAGIGAATVRRLATDGWSVLAGARRLDLLREVCEPVGAAAAGLDVTDEASVAEFVDVADRLGFGKLNLLVNNAGAALGVDSVEGAQEDLWRRMFELNVMGTLHLTRAFLGRLRASGDGHVVNLGSVAGFETYPGGGGYTASKHAVRALTKTLRRELLGEPVRVTEVAPGLVETEFSVVRFDGDRDRADSIYRGMTPLVADDVADCIAWAASRPSHVNIDEIVVRPRDQATATSVHRREEND